MERVKNILQRLQELYYTKHPKTAIDVDLMLDYTRVLYADLLEWRHRFKDELPAAKAAASDTAEQQATEPAAETVQTPAGAAPEAAVPVVQESSVQEAQPADKAYQPVQHDEPAPKEVVLEETPAVVATEPEKVPLDILQTDHTGISFEPPVAPEVKTEIKEELLVEAPAVNPVVEEKPAPAAAAIPLPDMSPALEGKPSDLFSSVKMPRDIRTAIGINDKYLFLNELFNNHKSNYEETLDQLNRFATVQQAEEWIRTKVAPAHRWDREDATVESFYAILNRHFSER